MYESTLLDSLSKYDLRTSDLLHLIEDNNLNAAQCCMIIKELKKIRNERRKVKCDIGILKTFKENQNKMLKRENRQMLLADVNKTLKKVSSKYNNRIYSENFEEIFEKRKKDELLQ